MSYVFRDVPRGQAFRLRKVGLAASGMVRRLPMLSVSAGSAPSEIAEMVSIADSSHAVEQATPWIDRIRTWAEAAFQGNLEMRVLEMYFAWYSPDHADWQQHDPETAAQFAEKLAELLERELKLARFFPARYRDYESGWMELAFRRPVMTGRVRNVVRPGLQDAEGRLRVTAIVDVE